MVAGPAYFCTHHFRRTGYFRKHFGNGPLYLHFILMNKPGRYKELETILVLVLASVALYWHYKNPLFLLIALITGLTGLFVPAAGSVIHWLWMKLAEGLGFVMNKIILTVIFVFIVIPLGWLSGKTGRSSVKLKAGGATYFRERNHVFTKEDMENPW